MAPVNQLGYGVVGYNILKNLVMGGNIVCFFPIGPSTWDGDEKSKEIIQGTVNNSQFLDFSAPSVKIWHQHDMALFPGRGLRAGWPIFELNRFKDQELLHLRSLDRIIVCSEWAARVVKDNGINIPTYVVPLGVDRSLFYSDEAVRNNRPYYNKDKTIFLNVGKWEVRKGHNELLDAFNKAFNEADNVELWMMNENFFIGIENEIWKQRYLASKLGSKIRLKPRVKTHHELRELYNRVDCGVFPSHAEGWNLEPLEMMSCGTPVIATNYSGHTAYLNVSNSFLINPIGMEIAQDGKWFKGEGEWCKFSVDDLAEQMRNFHLNKQKGNLPTLPLIETAEKFTWKNSVEALLEAVK